MALRVRVPKEIKTYKERIIGTMDLRQRNLCHDRIHLFSGHYLFPGLEVALVNG